MRVKLGQRWKCDDNFNGKRSFIAEIVEIKPNSPLMFVKILQIFEGGDERWYYVGHKYSPASFYPDREVNPIHSATSVSTWIYLEGQDNPIQDV